MASPSIPIILAHIADRVLSGLPPEKGEPWCARVRAALGRGNDLADVPWRFLYWLVTGSGLPDLDEPVIKAPIDACAAILRARAARKAVCPDAAGDAVRAVRGAAFKAALAGFSEATGYCAALGVEAAILELESGKAAAAKAVDAIEAAEWAVERGAEPALYSRMAETLAGLVDRESTDALAADRPRHKPAGEAVSARPATAGPGFDLLEAARRALLEYLDSLTGADGETDPDRLRDAIAVAADRLLATSLLLHKAAGNDPGQRTAEPVAAPLQSPVRKTATGCRAGDRGFGLREPCLRQPGAAQAENRSARAPARDDRLAADASPSPRPGRQTAIRPRAADDFAAIRARLAELRRDASEPLPVDEIPSR
jgi:hypothetical protein